MLDCQTPGQTFSKYFCIIARVCVCLPSIAGMQKQRQPNVVHDDFANTLIFSLPPSISIYLLHFSHPLCIYFIISSPPTLPSYFSFHLLHLLISKIISFLCQIISSARRCTRIFYSCATFAENLRLIR